MNIAEQIYAQRMQYFAVTGSVPEKLVVNPLAKMTMEFELDRSIVGATFFGMDIKIADKDSPYLTIM